jgi:Ca-activated chloride channel family protein
VKRTDRNGNHGTASESTSAPEAIDTEGRRRPTGRRRLVLGVGALGIVLVAAGVLVIFAPDSRKTEPEVRRIVSYAELGAPPSLAQRPGAAPDNRPLPPAPTVSGSAGAPNGARPGPSPPNLHFRGGRSGDVTVMHQDELQSLPIETYQEAVQLKAGGGIPLSSGVPPGSPAPGPGRTGPPLTGGTHPVNGRPFDATFFEAEETNPFISSDEDSLATFAMDVDRASYTLTRTWLDNGNIPPREAIRVEEFVNALRHDYPPPAPVVGSMWNGNAHGSPETFAVHLAAGPSPFGAGLTLLRVGLRARDVPDVDRKPATLTFVIDVSGSMAQDNRLGLVKRALRLLLDRLDERDEVGIVVYGTNARLVSPHRSLAARDELEAAIEALVPEGSTNAEAGLREGYRMAAGSLAAGRIHRVVLCSDGVANVGLTGADDILAVVRREVERGIELTTVGFGLDNYNDVLMEKLANDGNGSYWYVDNLDEARRVFVETLTGTLQTVARQAKVQVEFDPGLVDRYRLLGYENRDVADRDFRNDRVDAGEVGAGHEVTALFEMKLKSGSLAAAGSARRPIATVRIRYEDVESGVVREEATPLTAAMIATDAAARPPDLEFDAAVAEFAELLRGSYWARGSSLEAVLSLARSAVDRLGERPDRVEFLGMIETAEQLRAALEARSAREDDGSGDDR